MKTALASSGGGGTSIAQVRNTDTSTNINGASWGDRPVNGITDFMDADFSLGTNGIICNFSGRVKATAHIGYTTIGARVSVNVGIAVAGVDQPVKGKSGYVRAASGHNEATGTAQQYITVLSGDEVTLRTFGEAVGTATVMDNGGCILLLERQ